MMWWQEQSWTTIEALDNDIPVVVPLGSLEQHGPHLPLFVDTMQVSEIAQRVEAAMGDDILVLPTLWLGCSHHHRDFAGTVSVLPSLYSEMIKSVALSILEAGFQRIFFMNGHGGNLVPASLALTELVDSNDEADNAFLTLATWWHLARESMAQDKLGMESPNLTHACEYETSMSLYLRPDLVELNKAENLEPTADSPFFSHSRSDRVQYIHRWYRFSAIGSSGKPLAATKEKGEAIFEAATADVIAFLRDFRTWESRPLLKNPKRT